MFSLLRYDTVILKQPISYSFSRKVLKSCKILKNKKSPLPNSPHEFGKMLVVWGEQDIIEYSKYYKFLFKLMIYKIIINIWLFYLFILNKTNKNNKSNLYLKNTVTYLRFAKIF